MTALTILGLQMGLAMEIGAVYGVRCTLKQCRLSASSAHEELALGSLLGLWQQSAQYA